MTDYQIEEMMSMYKRAKAELEGNCPLLEDEVFVAMVDRITELQNKISDLRLEIRGQDELIANMRSELDCLR